MNKYPETGPFFDEDDCDCPPRGKCPRCGSVPKAELDAKCAETIRDWAKDARSELRNRDGWSHAA